MSDDVSIELDFDEGTMIIVAAGKEYPPYSLDEIPNNLVDRLIRGNSEYTVYSQNERYTEDNLSREEVLNAITEEEIIVKH